MRLATRRMPDGSCCNSRYVSRDGKSGNPGVQKCGPIFFFFSEAAGGRVALRGATLVRTGVPVCRLSVDNWAAPREQALSRRGRRPRWRIKRFHVSLFPHSFFLQPFNRIIAWICGGIFGASSSTISPACFFFSIIPISAVEHAPRARIIPAYKAISFHVSGTPRGGLNN